MRLQRWQQWLALNKVLKRLVRGLEIRMIAGISKSSYMLSLYEKMKPRGKKAKNLMFAFPRIPQKQP